jgi:hypothetical protein
MPPGLPESDQGRSQAFPNIYRAAGIYVEKSLKRRGGLPKERRDILACVRSRFVLHFCPQATILSPDN